MDETSDYAAQIAEKDKYIAVLEKRIEEMGKRAVRTADLLKDAQLHRTSLLRELLQRDGLIAEKP